MTCLFLSSFFRSLLSRSISAVCPLHFRHSIRGDSREGTSVIDRVNHRKAPPREQPSVSSAVTQNGAASIRNSLGATTTPSEQPNDVRVLHGT